MRYFEDLIVGEETVFGDDYRVTEAEIVEVGRRWDPQPFHIDREAAKDSIFGGLVASSAHIFAIAVRIGNAEIDREKRIASVSALGFDKLRWHAPARPGDVLKTSFRILAARESRSRPHLGVVTNAATLTNQKDEAVFSYECSFLVPKRDV